MADRGCECVRVALCSALLCSSAFYVCSAVYKGGAGAGCMGVCACVLLLRCPAFCSAMSLLHFAVVAWLRLCMPRCPDVVYGSAGHSCPVLYILYTVWYLCNMLYKKPKKRKIILLFRFFAALLVKFVQFNGINMHTMLNCSTPKTKIFLDFLGLLWYNLTVR